MRKIKIIARWLWRLPFQLFGKCKKRLTIKYDGLTLNYSTRSPIAKRWFYPRYISGDRLHEPPISSLIRSELNSSSTFFDVGANLGFFTILAANICTSSEGEVHAFELDPSLIPLIEDSLVLNENCGRTLLNCVACSDETGELYTYQAAQELNPSTNQVILSRQNDQGLSTQIMTMTLDHYWQSTGASPDLIKMDIEGAESLAVPGMLKLIEETSPKLILEVHPEDVRQFGRNPTSLVKQLRDVGDYKKVLRVESYRDTFEQRGDVLTEFDINAFEGRSPVVLFFSS